MRGAAGMGVALVVAVVATPSTALLLVRPAAPPSATANAFRPVNLFSGATTPNWRKSSPVLARWPALAPRIATLKSTMTEIPSEEAPSKAPEAASGALRRTAVRFGVTAVVWALAASAAVASGDPEKLHLGQKVALYLERTGLPQEAILLLISAMPVVELRGGVPVGLWMGLPVAKTALLCVLGNMLPVLPVLLALRAPAVRKLLAPILERAKSKAEAFADEDTRVRSLALFVGIPLPGTGAWTGAMGAFLVGMPVRTAFGAIFAGVVLAACIMSLVVTTGTLGGVVATLALVAIFAAQTMGKQAKKKAGDGRTGADSGASPAAS